MNIHDIEKRIKDEIALLEEVWSDCYYFVPNDEGALVREPKDNAHKQKAIHIRFAILELESILSFIKRDKGPA